jgi:hypothetical protein
VARQVREVRRRRLRSSNLPIPQPEHRRDRRARRGGGERTRRSSPRPGCARSADDGPGDHAPQRSHTRGGRRPTPTCHSDHAFGNAPLPAWRRSGGHGAALPRLPGREGERQRADTMKELPDEARGENRDPRAGPRPTALVFPPPPPPPPRKPRPRSMSACRRCRDLRYPRPRPHRQRRPRDSTCPNARTCTPATSSRRVSIPFFGDAYPLDFGRDRPRASAPWRWDVLSGRGTAAWAIATTLDHHLGRLRNARRTSRTRAHAARALGGATWWARATFPGGKARVGRAAARPYAQLDGKAEIGRHSERRVGGWAGWRG